MNISKQAVLEIISNIKKFGQIDEALNTCLIDNINALPSISDGWIKDVYPEKECSVLVYQSKYRQDNVIARYYPQDKSFWVGMERITDYVTHWQSLPKKPQK